VLHWELEWAEGNTMLKYAVIFLLLIGMSLIRANIPTDMQVIIKKYGSPKLVMIGLQFKQAGVI
jgi:hypothetical protein